MYFAWTSDPKRWNIAQSVCADWALTSDGENRVCAASGRNCDVISPITDIGRWPTRDPIGRVQLFVRSHTEALRGFGQTHFRVSLPPGIKFCPCDLILSCTLQIRHD